MLACRWNKLLTCFVIFWAKQQLMMHFIQNASLNFYSFSDIYSNGSGSSIDKNRLYCISTNYWVENLQLSFCFSILKAHTNLNCIHGRYGQMERKCLDNKVQVLTNIWYIVIYHKMCLFGICGFPIWPSYMVV